LYINNLFPKKTVSLKKLRKVYVLFFEKCFVVI
jgi:hypothetical protein